LYKRLRIPEIKKHPFFKGINWEEIRNSPAVMVPEKTKTEQRVPSMTSLIRNSVLPNPFEQAEGLQPLELEV
jgi:hypothetical protein